MRSKMRIGILGAGAVGGFFCCKLAAHYKDSKDIEIILIARGKSEAVIKERGIKVITPDEEIIARPHIITNDTDEVGELDVLMLATKSYDLEEALVKVLPAIKPTTLILPVLNGVNTRDEIREITTKGEVLHGFVYIVATLTEPGLITVGGKTHSLNFGPVESDHQPKELRDIFRAAGINAIVPENIVKAAWEKFFFISTMATITSYYDKSIHEISDEKEMRERWKSLIEELEELAIKKEIPVKSDIVETTMAKADILPADATTSMSRDFQKKGRTEVESLTGYVVDEGRKFDLEMPLYNKFYSQLVSRTKVDLK